jgi:hypothetical protein
LEKSGAGMVQDCFALQKSGMFGENGWEKVDIKKLGKRKDDATHLR